MESSPVGFDPILIVQALPGDTALFLGGTLALLSDAGSSITVVIAIEDLVVADMLQAVGADAATHLVLGAPGARISGSSPRVYGEYVEGQPAAQDALAASDPAELAADLATVIATTGARRVLGPPEDLLVEHPDRLALSTAARRAAEVMRVPYHPVATDPSTNADEVDVSEVFARKVAAVGAHRSRFTVEGDTVLLRDGSRMPLTRVERVVGRESFDHEADTVGPTTEWSKLGTGGRITALISALLLGAVVGAVGSVVFSVAPMLLGRAVPVGLIGALVVVGATLTGLRLLTGTRVVAAFAALGLLGVTAVLSQESPGGSILIPAQTLSYYWVYGPVLIAFLVLAWPDVRRRSASDAAGVRIAEPSNRKEHPQT